MLDPKSPERVHRGTMWAVIGDNRDVLFRYTPTGEGPSGPWAFLAGRSGYVQADASNFFDRLFTGRAAIGGGAGLLEPRLLVLGGTRGHGLPRGVRVKLIARLYRIEHLADARWAGARGAT